MHREYRLAKTIRGVRDHVILEVVISDSGEEQATPFFSLMPGTASETVFDVAQAFGKIYRQAREDAGDPVPDPVTTAPDGTGQSLTHTDESPS